MLTVALLLWSRLPRSWLLLRMSVLAASLLPILILLPLTVPADPSADAPLLTFSIRGLQLAGLIAAKGAAIGLLALFLLGTTPLATLGRAAHAIGIPGTFVHLLLLAYRYGFVLIEELNRLRTALRVRGFRARSDMRTFRLIGQIAGVLILRGADRAERVSHAMRCRGFAGRYYTLEKFHTRAADVVFALVLITLIGLVVAGDRGWIRTVMR
jgi:cobalt/nickel transport system permease protein